MIAQRNNDTNGAVSRNLFSSSPVTFCFSASVMPAGAIQFADAPPDSSTSTKECDRKNTPAPPQPAKCTGFLDLRVLYGTCSE
jgi:hypothetical protein